MRNIHFQQFLFSSGFESHIKKLARKKNDYRTGAMRVSSGSQNPLEIYVFSHIQRAEHGLKMCNAPAGSRDTRPHTLLYLQKLVGQ
jgi:hypothetical protein